MSTDSIVDPQATVVSQLESELAELEKEALASQEGSEKVETTPKETPVEEEATQGVTETPDTPPEEAAATVTKGEPQDDIKAKLEQLDTRWRDGVKWSTKLNKENIGLKAEKERLAKQLEDLQAKLKGAPKETPPEVQAVAEEYPELMEKLLPAIEKMTAGAKDTSMAEELAEIKRVQAAQSTAEDEAYILQQHPDAELVVAENSTFWKWIKEDTSLSAFQKQISLDQGSAKDKAILIGQFKREFQESRKKTPPPGKDNAAVKQKLKDAAEATAEPKTSNAFTLPVTNKAKLTSADLDRMSPEELFKLSNDELKQIALAEASMV